MPGGAGPKGNRTVKRGVATGCGLLALAGVGVLTTAAMFMMAVSSTESSAAQGAVSRCTLTTSGGVTVGQLDPEQVRNARRIIAVGKSADIPARG